VVCSPLPLVAQRSAPCAALPPGSSCCWVVVMLDHQSTCWVCGLQEHQQLMCVQWTRSRSSGAALFAGCVCMR
jgi:hypothetical protein